MEVPKNYKFDYWHFIEKYFPNYSSCDQILESDILARKLERRRNKQGR